MEINTFCYNTCQEAQRLLGTLGHIAKMDRSPTMTNVYEFCMSFSSKFFNSKGAIHSFISNVVLSETYSFFRWKFQKLTLRG